MTTGDTIAAISSATGPAARMIVRIGGVDAWRMAAGLAAGLPGEPNAASRVTLSFASLQVPAWAYVFRAPRSYSGEDLIELHIPGNPVLASLLLRELLCRGARAAEAGEFTARAYFNGRLDLTGAEGVAAAIAAGSEAELLAARQLMAGELARRLRPAMDAIAETLALVEVGIDFSDEDVSFISPALAEERIASAESALSDLVASSARFDRISHEPRFVLVGRPNAGKSTLLNALAGRERAVTSSAAGTTRDALVAEVTLRRGIIRLTDVAGLEDSAPSAGSVSSPQAGSGEAPTCGIDSQNALAEIERQMRDQALRAVETADRIILVCDGTDSRPPLKLPRSPDLTVWTKADLIPPASGRVNDADLSLFPSPGNPGEGRVGASSIRKDPRPNPPPEYREREKAGAWSDGFHEPNELPRSGRSNFAAAGPRLQLSALTGFNLDMLRSALDLLAFGGSTAGATLALNARHLRSIDEALSALRRAVGQARKGLPEFLALELREALNALGQIIGQVTPDDLLGRIFSSFCIGK